MEAERLAFPSLLLPYPLPALSRPALPFPAALPVCFPLPHLLGSQTLATSQIQPYHPFYAACELRMVSTFSDGWEENSEEFCDKRTQYEIQISESINKVLLASSQAHLFMYCLWLPSRRSERAESSCCGRAQSLKYLLFGFSKKKVCQSLI